MELSFDECVKMALEEPDAYECYRKKMIEACIGQTSPQIQRRLRGIQFRIDMERRKAKAPMASCVRLFDMMIDHFYDEHVPLINRQVKNLRGYVKEEMIETSTEKMPVKALGKAADKTPRAFLKIIE